MGFKRQYQLAEKLKSFFPNETSRKSVKILDVAAGTGLVGVGLKKEGLRDQKNHFFCLLFVYSNLLDLIYKYCS